MTALREEFKKRSTAELSDLLTQYGILHAPINTYASLLTHEQSQAVNAFHLHLHDGMDKPLPFANTPGQTSGSSLSDAPHLGEYTREAMTDWGLSDGELNELAGCGAMPPSAQKTDAVA